MDVFSSLSEPTRRNIIELLSVNGPLTATDIYNHFSVSNPAISQHLKVLRESGLVQVQKQSQQRLYQINPQKLNEISRWINEIKKIWNNRFDRLDKILQTEKMKGK